MQGSEWPQIIHHGAHAGVTGSCHQLLADEQTSYLVDCGLFQGAETTDVERGVHARLAIDFDISTVKALVVTHVHIDHVGRIPWLLEAGFDGPIYCSEPSAQLLPIVLEDAFKLSISRERELVDGYLRLLHKRIVAVPYNQWIQLSQDRVPRFVCVCSGLGTFWVRPMWSLSWPGVQRVSWRSGFCFLVTWAHPMPPF